MRTHTLQTSHAHSYHAKAAPHHRWTPLLMTIAYAVFGGLSFPFFHQSMCAFFQGDLGALRLVPILDAAYIVLTIVLVFLLVYRLLNVIDGYERALAASERRFRDLVNSTGDLIWEIDDAARITFVNHSIEPLLGYTAEEVIGKPIFEIMLPEQAKQAEERFARLQAERTAFTRVELKLQHRDGRTVVVESSGTPIIGPDGAYLGCHGIDRDVTECKQAELLSFRSYEFYRALFETLPLPVWRTDTNGNVIYCNQAGIDYCGAGIDYAQKWFGEMHPDDQLGYLAAYTAAFETQQRFTVTARLRRADGAFHRVSLTGQPSFDPERTFIGYIGYFYEIEPVTQSAVS